MSFSDLNSDIIGHIIPYLNFSTTRYDNQMLRFRLLNKATNIAVMKYRPFWVDTLVKYGPKRIGPTSIHRNNTNNCKYNKQSKCHIAAHYSYLEAVYNKDEQFGAYEAVIKWLLPKMKRRAVSRIKAEKSKLEKLESQIRVVKRKISNTEDDLEYINNFRKKMKKK